MFALAIPKRKRYLSASKATSAASVKQCCNDTLSDPAINWITGNSVCIVIASKGYPGKPQTGDVIHGLDDAKAIAGVEVFHAGTTSGADDTFMTSGGRVLGVTATGKDRETALASAYTAVGKISFDGMQYRSRHRKLNQDFLTAKYVFSCVSRISRLIPVDGCGFA